MKKNIVSFFVLFATICFASVIFDADFEKDFSVFKNYSRGAAPKLENKRLFVDLGTTLKVNLPEEGRYEISAKVSAKCTVQFAVFGKPATTFSSVNDASGVIKLSYYANEEVLSLCVFSNDKSAEKKVFHLESLKIEKGIDPETEYVDVKEVAFEAEDFLGGNGWTRNDPQASAGIYRSGQRWYRPVENIPVPKTAKELYLYVRARQEKNNDMAINIARERQVFYTEKVQASDFSWMKFGPLNAKALFPKISLTIAGVPNVNVDIDKVLWSTNGNLDNRILETVKAENLKEALLSAVPGEKALIDGKLNDPCWQNAPTITPFRIITANEYAKEQTAAKIVYDSEKLYFAFNAQESALVPANQRMHEFVNKLKEADINKSFTDDSVVVLLMRKDSKTMYEFVVNPSGVVSSALAKPPNYWTGRESLAHPGIEAAAQIGDGFYNVELAVPFTAIGGQPKGDNDFTILLGRYEKSQSEVSSFSAVDKGFHLEHNLIPLHFAEKGRALQINKMPSFLSGENKFDISGEELLFVNHLQSTKAAKTFTSTDSSFAIAESGEFTFNCSIYDPASLKALIKMPSFTSRTRSSQLQFKAEKGIEVSLNGKTVNSGAALSTGANLIRVSGENAKNFTMQIGEELVSVDESWVAENKSYYKNLLLEHSIVWPDWTKEGVSIVGGEIQQILFPPVCPSGFEVNDYAFHVDLPEDFIFEGASGYYKTYNFEILEEGSFVKNGQNYKRYTIDFINDIKPNDKLPSHLYVAFLIRAPKTDKKLEQNFYFHCSAKSKTMSEMPNICKVYILPTRSSKTPKNVHAQLWTSWLKNIDDETVKAKIVDGIARAGYTEINTTNQQGLKYFTLVDFKSWNLNTQPFLETHPGNELQTFLTGKKDNSLTCPTVMVEQEDFRKWFNQAFRSWYFEKSKSPDIVCWDFEGGVFTSYLACSCNRCISKFAKRYKVSEKISPTEIQEKYRAEWIDFMTSQMADMAAIFYEELKIFSPQTQFYIYSGYESAQTKFQYGVDWKKVANYMDFGGAGYGRPKKEIDATVEACKPNYAIMGVIANPYQVSSRLTPTYTNSAELMRAMCDSSGGILIYNYPTLDGKSFNAQAEVSTIVAENEEFFAAGKFKLAQNKIKAKGSEYFVREDKDGNLLLVFINQGRNKVNCSASSANKGKIIDCKTGKEVKEINTVLEPEEIAVYKIFSR